MPSRSPAGRSGRPRSAAADAAILAATREALVELGWSRLTLGDVAARAGVASRGTAREVGATTVTKPLTGRAGARPDEP